MKTTPFILILGIAFAMNAGATVYTGFGRVNVGLFEFTDLSDPDGTKSKIGAWPFPETNWQCSAYNGTRYLVFGRSTPFGGPGLFSYDGDTSLIPISGSYDFLDWHGIAEYGGEYYGLYHGTNMSAGLYRFTNPADPENTATRLFPTQSFSENIWLDVAYDGSVFRFVRSAEGGAAGIYEYALDFDDFNLVSGSGSYTSWRGLGAWNELIDPPIVSQSSNKKVYVILFGGQSNAAGWGYHQYLLEEAHPLAVPQNDVEMYTGSGTNSVLHQLLPLQSGAANDWINPGVEQFPGLTAPVSRFGPELSMARTVRDGIDILHSKVVVIKYAVGGSTLYNHWRGDGTDDSSSDGPLYKTFQSTVNAGITAIQAANPYHEVEVIGMGWVQGESDALNDSGVHAADYEANLTTFIADVRATFGSDIVFALSKLSPNQVNDHPYWPTIRAAQDAVAAADPRVIATETLGDNYLGATGFAEGQIHYLSSALLQIGEDLGNAILEVAALDADGDHLPDKWENSFDPPGAAGLGNAPDDDYDGDGISDRGEFSIGTSPVDPMDGLSLSISKTNGLQWSAKRGISYGLWGSTNLLPKSWTLVDTVLVETDEEVTVAPLPIVDPATDPQVFFRLKVGEQ